MRDINLISCRELKMIMQSNILPPNLGQRNVKTNFFFSIIVVS